jgi:hypothetical protein
MQNRLVLRIFALVAPWFTWIITALIPGRKAAVMAAECRNKCTIMTLVQGLDSYVDPEGTTPLQTIVERCYALGSFPALWAIEGAGKDLAEWHLARNSDPVRILTDAVLDPKWDKALLMLHAGIGLGFAKHLVETLPSVPSQEHVHTLVTRAIELCRNNSRPGYCGAAIESLGLVSRFMRDAAFCRRVHDVLANSAPDSVGFFWRGVGRCLYFHPINFLPGLSRPCRAIDLCKAEAPSLELVEALLSGTAWALTVVNMAQPQVMEWVLAHDADYFNGSPGFLNGVMSSVIMRCDTTPGMPLVEQFMNHQPDSPNHVLGDLWTCRIRQTMRSAIDTIHPVLKKHNRLDEIFRYQQLADLATQLELQSPPRFNQG